MRLMHRIHLDILSGSFSQVKQQRNMWKYETIRIKQNWIQNYKLIGKMLFLFEDNDKFPKTPSFLGI